MISRLLEAYKLTGKININVRFDATCSGIIERIFIRKLIQDPVDMKPEDNLPKIKDGVDGGKNPEHIN